MHEEDQVPEHRHPPREEEGAGCDGKGPYQCRRDNGLSARAVQEDEYGWRVPQVNMVSRQSPVHSGPGLLIRDDIILG